MKFWYNGRKLDTNTMTAKEKIEILCYVEGEIDAVSAMIAEFNKCEDLKEFSVKHFGRDGDYAMYTDRNHVSRFLEWKLNDILNGDCAKALSLLGCEPCNI